MALDKIVEALSESQRYYLAVELCECALPIWDEYAAKNELTYIDSIVGMFHKVDKEILSRSLNAVVAELEESGTQTAAIEELRQEFVDPIVSLQDDDWQLPNPVVKIFYSVRNLLDKVAGQNETLFNEPQLYVVINQACDALLASNTMSVADINKILAKYSRPKI